jgi:hypothetical protein
MLRASRNHIQGLYWYLANDPSVPEATRKKPRGAWGLTKDEFTDNGGWPRAFYVRNGRRLVGDFGAHRSAPPGRTINRRRSRTHRPHLVATRLPPRPLHSQGWASLDGRRPVFDNSANPNWIPCGVPYRSLTPKSKERRPS